MSWPDGRKYHGTYLKDQKHGEGVMEWRNCLFDNQIADGKKYDGHWEYGK